MPRFFEAVREALARFWEDRVHFIELHYLYIGFMIFFTSGLYYCQPGTDWDYVDALFMATTGSTNTGLNTIATSTYSTYQLLLLYFTSFITSHITISYIVLMVRKHYFSKRFEDILLFNKARRMREELRRKEKLAHDKKEKNRTHDDLEIGFKRRNTTASSIKEESLKRFPSLSSTASSPVRGVKSRRSRRRSIGTWMSNPNDIRDFFREIREEQNKMMDKREAEAMAAVQRAAAAAAHHNSSSYNNNSYHSPSSSPLAPNQLPSGKDIYDEDEDEDDYSKGDNDLRLTSTQMSSPMHPFEQHHQTTTSDPNDLRRVTSATTTVGGSSSSHAGGRTEDTSQQGIAFAGNVEQQREVARKRLEQDRRFEELMAKISREHDIPLTDTLLDSDDEDDEELFQEIMRQPIDKSQLTRQQRYRIGGIEYRALDMLSYIVPLYYVGSIVVASFAYRIHVAVNGYTQGVLETSNPNGPTNAWIFSFFMGMSGMNNLGMSPLDASMVPFQNTPFPLICTMIQILAGNTAYAILLRFIIWVLWKTTPQRYAMRRETFRFLLDHPRRCYTTLFPSTQTWWLLIILVVITVVELVCFLALNYWLPVLEGLPWGSRFLDGLFQSIATRNAGFTVTSLSDLNPGTQLVYIVAMYISVYPVAISMRNSNVYQERALGIFRGDDDEEGPVKFSESDLRGPAPFIKLRRHPTINSVMTTSRKVLRGPDFYVVNLIQRQLTSDICWVISGIFAIAVIESQSIMSPSPTTMMTVIYECVSAFGNVGASTGYPNTATSQGAQYHTLGKLVLILLMYRGRHRGLPLAIDRAVLLPSEQLEQREVEDNILKRRNTSMTTQSASNVLFYTRSSTL